jgi:putative transposase
MPHTLGVIYVHLIFSTKGRVPCLEASLRPRLFAYLATLVRDQGCECPRAGGVADHVHLAVRLSRTISVATLVEDVKIASSKWIKAQAPELSNFAWQPGYGVFSVGPSDLKALLNYIDKQEEHHLTKTFEEEFRMFLAKYDIAFDEQYLWK